MPYSATSDHFELNDPEFVNSYQEATINDFTPQIPGIVYISVTTMLFFIVIAICERRTHH